VTKTGGESETPENSQALIRVILANMLVLGAKRAELQRSVNM